MTRPILAAESVTELGERVRGAVLVAGSHGGIIASFLGASAGAHALVLNDAGIGKDQAGIAGLDYLESIGMAAAVVAHNSARIGDGADSLAHGVISRANRHAANAGVTAGMAARAAATLLCNAPVPSGPPPPYMEGRWLLESINGTQVWALDSVGKLVPEDAGRILLVGSHGALHGGRPDSALNLRGTPIAARAVVFNDAGIGKDGAGVTRPPELDARGVPAGTASHTSARIGDGRSIRDSGVLSAVNHVAMRAGVRVGMTVGEFISLL